MLKIEVQAKKNVQNIQRVPIILRRHALHGGFFYDRLCQRRRGKRPLSELGG
jgi:hypothetical protein